MKRIIPLRRPRLPWVPTLRESRHRAPRCTSRASSRSTRPTVRCPIPSSSRPSRRCETSKRSSAKRILALGRRQIGRPACRHERLRRNELRLRAFLCKRHARPRLLRGRASADGRPRRNRNDRGQVARECLPTERLKPFREQACPVRRKGLIGHQGKIRETGRVSQRTCPQT